MHELLIRAWTPFDDVQDLLKDLEGGSSIMHDSLENEH